MAILERMRNAWNVFRKNEEQNPYDLGVGPTVSSSSSPSRPRRAFNNERTIISSIYARMSIDVAAIEFHHVKVDEENRYTEDIDSPLNDCLTIEPNIDQGPRAFRQDLVLTLFDRGVAAIVPIDTTVDPQSGETVDIYSMRIGEITQWYPKHVRVSVYNEAKGIREEITVQKKSIGIVENPLYTVMNEPNSTLQRLIRTLSLLDVAGENSSAGKLDLIIQLPYVVKSKARQEQAAQRREEIEMQLQGSKYGIAYTDGTEKVTQLNRPAENNLLATAEMLIELLYSQLGITKGVMDGTADEAAMINYFNRTVEPIADAIQEAMQRSFLGLLRMKKKERIAYFNDPFKLIPLSQLAEITDKFTRNEVLSSNEIRGKIGFKPSKDPKADKLINSNMPQPLSPEQTGISMADMDAVMQEVFDGLSSDLDGMLSDA